MAELYDDLRRAAAPTVTAGAERFTVYLVPGAAEAEAFVQARRAAPGADALSADEMVIPDGTPEEQAKAQIILQELELYAQHGRSRPIDVRRWP